MYYRVEWHRRSGAVVVELDGDASESDAIAKARTLTVRIPLNQEAFPDKYVDLPFVLPVGGPITDLDVEDTQFNVDVVPEDLVSELTGILEVV